MNVTWCIFTRWKRRKLLSYIIYLFIKVYRCFYHHRSIKTLHKKNKFYLEHWPLPAKWKRLQPFSSGKTNKIVIKFSKNKDIKENDFQHWCITLNKILPCDTTFWHQSCFNLVQILFNGFIILSFLSEN